MNSFAKAKQMFDNELGKALALPYSLVPVDGKPRSNIPIRGNDDKPLVFIMMPDVFSFFIDVTGDIYDTMKRKTKRATKAK